MDNGVCTKGYPKDFLSQTSTPADGYPQYRRRDDGRTIRLGTFQVDNTWVVPYNPWLSKKFNAHINLEACMTVKSVKYLFKYIYKGHDCAHVEIQETNQLNHDAITTYLDARYVSATEAFWRLSEYKMHEQSHSVMRLPIHLPNQQPVYFQQGHEEEALDRATSAESLLTSWFHLNQNSQEALQHLYTEIPNHYVIKPPRKRWILRKRGGDKIIPRMYSVSPRDTERFHLRMLLLHKLGATSYEDLCTVNGHIAPTFKEACQLLNLLIDDTEWDNTLTEASAFQMPSRLRSLFATI